MTISFPERFNMANDFLDDRVREGRGDKVAVYYEGERYTYGEVRRIRFLVKCLQILIATNHRITVTHFHQRLSLRLFLSVIHRRVRAPAPNSLLESLSVR